MVLSQQTLMDSSSGFYNTESAGLMESTGQTTDKIAGKSGLINLFSWPVRSCIVNTLHMSCVQTERRFAIRLCVQTGNSSGHQILVRLQPNPKSAILIPNSWLGACGCSSVNILLICVCCQVGLSARFAVARRASL